MDRSAPAKVSGNSRVNPKICTFSGAPDRPGCVSHGSFPSQETFAQSVNVDRATTRGAEASAVLTRQEKTIKGSYYGGVNPARDFPMLLDLYAAGKLNLDDMISRRYCLDQINDAYADMRDGKLARVDGVDVACIADTDLDRATHLAREPQIVNRIPSDIRHIHPPPAPVWRQRRRRGARRRRRRNWCRCRRGDGRAPRRGTRLGAGGLSGGGGLLCRRPKR